MSKDRVFRATIMGVLGGVVSNAMWAALRAWWPALQSTAIASILWQAALFSVAVACIWVGFRMPKLLGMGKGIVASMLVLRGERVLLVHDDSLQKWVFPNDHVRLREGVHQTALRAVQDLGLRYAVSFPHRSFLDVAFDKRWHSVGGKVFVDRRWSVWRHPEPFYVQSERQEWNEGHSIHYDLVYVGCLENDPHDVDGIQKAVGSETRTVWLTLTEIESMIEEEKIYPDAAIIARLAIRGPQEPATR